MNDTAPHRALPGSTGEGHFYHIVIRPKDQFARFRVQDVGQRGGLERVAGQRPDGSWDTQAWLVAKTDAVVLGGKLVLKTAGARTLLKQIDGAITHVRGDIWHAHPKHVPEHEKPTEAQREAWNANLMKAHAARTGGTSAAAPAAEGAEKAAPPGKAEMKKAAAKKVVVEKSAAKKAVIKKSAKPVQKKAAPKKIVKSVGKKAAKKSVKKTAKKK